MVIVGEGKNRRLLCPADVPVFKTRLYQLHQGRCPWAEWIAWTIEEANYSVTLDVWDCRPGHDFVQKMDEALKQCEKLIAVLSEDYLQANFTQPEWRSAFADDPQEENRRLVFVRVRECQLEGLLKPRLYLDLVGASEADAKRDILAIWKNRDKPDTAPSFPGNASRVAPTAVEFPTAAKQRCLWTVPYPRNLFFTGRGEVLKTLRIQLNQGSSAALSQPAAVNGLGGIGKTQTAVELCLPLSRHL